MKRSCLSKKSKVVQCVTGDVISNESRGIVSKESQIYCNPFEADKNLKESGREGEQSGSLEKGISYNNTGALSNEKFQRTSPRLAKQNLSAAKWIDNSFDVRKKDEYLIQNKYDNEKIDNSKSVKKKFKELTPKKDVIIKTSELTFKSSKSKRLHSAFDFGSKDTNEASESNNSPHSKRKAQSIKNQALEENLRNKKNDSSGEVSPCFLIGKKRTSLTDKTVADFPKKFKMEESINNNNFSNNNESPNISDCSMLKFELELEKKRKCSPFVMRDINTIVAECESRNQKWKETFLKYDCPAQWGTPIVKNSSEKWDSKDIPLKLLMRFQKHLLSKNMCHPVFLPPDSQVYFKDVLPNLKSDLKIEVIPKEENGAKDLEEYAQDSYSQEEVSDPQNSMTDNSGRMVLRNRNQYKATVIEDDEDLSDDSDEWSNKQKYGKNKVRHRSPKNSLKKKRTAILNNQQLILNMEKCNINQKNGITTDEILGNNLSCEEDINLKTAPFAETMICPICSLRFSKQLIESHATECASKTYKD